MYNWELFDPSSELSNSNKFKETNLYKINFILGEILERLNTFNNQPC